MRLSIVEKRFLRRLFSNGITRVSVMPWRASPFMKRALRAGAVRYRAGYIYQNQSRTK